MCATHHSNHAMKPLIFRRPICTTARLRPAADRFVIKTLELLDDSDENGVQLPDEADKRSMLELGFTPSFYHFREATITAKVAFSAVKGEEFGVGAEAGGGYPGIFFVSVNASYSNKYSFTADGSSEVRTTIVSLPPPGPLTDILMERMARRQRE